MRKKSNWNNCTRKDPIRTRRTNRVERARQWRKRSNWGSAAGGPILTALSLASCFFLTTASIERRMNTFTRQEELSLSTPNLHFDDDSPPSDSNRSRHSMRSNFIDTTSRFLRIRVRTIVEMLVCRSLRFEKRIKKINKELERMQLSSAMQCRMRRRGKIENSSKRNSVKYIAHIKSCPYADSASCTTAFHRSYCNAGTSNLMARTESGATMRGLAI